MACLFLSGAVLTEGVSEECMLTEDPSVAVPQQRNRAQSSLRPSGDMFPWPLDPDIFIGL